MERLTNVEDCMPSEQHYAMSDSDVPVTFPSEVIIEGQHMQKVCVRFHKSVTSSRLNSSSSRDPVDTFNDARLQSSTEGDLALPFPQEVSRSSSEYDDYREINEAAGELRTTRDSGEFDAIKQAKDFITNGVTNLEKHYDLVHSRLQSALHRERKQLGKLQQQLDDVIVERTKLESENMSLKERLTKSEAEVERLQQKEIVDLKTRFSVEEELIKLRNSEHTASQFVQLRAELRETKAALEKVSQEKSDLENHLSKLMSLEKSRKSRLIWLEKPPRVNNTLLSTGWKTDGAVESHGTVSVTSLSERLQMIRRENTALLNSALPTIQHSRRLHARPVEDVMSVKPFERSEAGPGMLPMITKQTALAPLLH